MQTVLTIAGSDSGGGAGIQADLKTFSALGLFGTSVVTAVTAQNTTGVFAIHEVPLDVIAAQVDAVASDLRPAAVKIGMLASPAIVRLVAEKIAAHQFERVVVDPVMVAKSGDHLLRPEAVAALIRHLLPLAAVLTPNLPEAEVLLGRPVRSRFEQEQAARDIAALGPAAVVVKGGHSSGDPIDILVEGGRLFHFATRRIATTSTHGTGCTFSSAIAGYLALGQSVPDAVASAKRYLTGAIAAAPGLGHGHGPVNHHWRQTAGASESISRR